jgi:hypothetical protein
MSLEEELGYQDGLYARIRMGDRLSEDQQEEIAWGTFCDWVSLKDLTRYTEGWKKGYSREPGRKETTSD